jgi:mycofactocin biosynthesis protein MftB
LKRFPSTGCAGSTDNVSTSTPAPPVAFDTARPWGLSPKVAVRPESFGALCYHYGTRRLLFLKSPVLADLVRTIGDYPSVDAALDDRCPPASRAAMTRALAGLVTAEVLDVR